MKLNAYSLNDKKSRTFAAPFFFHNDAQAIRALVATARDEITTIAKFPEDFDLYRIGSFDDSTGQLETLTPEFLVNAQEILAQFDHHDRLAARRAKAQAEKETAA